MGHIKSDNPKIIDNLIQVTSDPVVMVIKAAFEALGNAKAKTLATINTLIKASKNRFQKVRVAVKRIR